MNYSEKSAIQDTYSQSLDELMYSEILIKKTKMKKMGL